MSTQRYKAQEVVDAIRASNGVVQQAASALGCSPRTIYNYADRYVTVEEALDESRKDIAGEAEGYLIAMMRDREHPKHYKAVKDVLRNYHPDDWSDQKLEQDTALSGQDGGAIQINVVNAAPDPDDDAGD